jgi:hypothetical protein
MSELSSPPITLAVLGLWDPQLVHELRCLEKTFFYDYVGI